MANLRLTRDQLAKFLPDHESIRQFEQLFAIADSIAPDVPNEIKVEAGSANSQANNAIAQVVQLAQDVSVSQSVMDAKINQALSTAEQAKRDLGILLTKPVDVLPNTIPADAIELNINGVPSGKVGQISWDEFDNTAQISHDYGVVQQVGMELYARVENATGVTIPNGTAVGFSGVGAGNNLSVTPYNADGSVPTLYILGIMTHDLPNSGEVGFCTVWGHVRDVDTSAFNVGDVLYCDPATPGGLTNVKPTADNAVIPIAAVLSVGVSGEIFVRPTIEQQKRYGSFTKTSNQSPASTNTAYAFTFDNTENANGVSIGTPASRIVVAESGLYQFDTVLQLTSGSSSAKNVWVWFRKNGTDIANSARIVTSDVNNGYIPISLIEFFSLAANDYIEIMFAADSTNVAFDSVAATAFAPAAPSVMLSVTQVQQ
jgi:hypothetical protein